MDSRETTYSYHFAKTHSGQGNIIRLALFFLGGIKGGMCLTNKNSCQFVSIRGKNKQFVVNTRDTRDTWRILSTLHSPLSSPLQKKSNEI